MGTNVLLCFTGGADRVELLHCTCCSIWIYDTCSGKEINRNFFKACGPILGKLVDGWCGK